MTTAEDRGWGPAYPNHCAEARDNCVEVEVAGCTFIVHHTVASLMEVLAWAWHRTVEPLDPAQCWSFACRAVRGSIAPSNHSWGLALDLNSAKHPLGSVGTFSENQRRSIRSILARPEFRHFTWGGNYTSRKDEMHVEYTGTPAQAVADTRLLSGTEEDDVDEATLERVLRKVINEVFTAPGSNGAADSVDDDRAKINAVLSDLTEVKTLLQQGGTTTSNGGLPATFIATFTQP